jgi:hypothetical protein
MLPDAELFGISLNSPSWDLFIILFFVVAVVLYGFALGRSRILTLLFSIYVAYTVISEAPFLQNPSAFSLQVDQFFVLRVSGFVGLFIVLFFVMSRSALSTLSDDDDGAWWHVIIYSILHVGLLLSLTLSFLPPAVIDSLAPITRTVFVNEWSRFGWVFAPVVAAMVFRKRKRRGSAL